MSLHGRHLQALLGDDTSASYRYAEHLLSHLEEGDFVLPALCDAPKLSCLALFGLEESEWRDAVRAARLSHTLSFLSDGFPLVSLSDDRVESDGGRLQIWQGQCLRPSSLEVSLKISTSPCDMQTLTDALSLLPTGWSLVLEIRRGTG